VLLSVLKKKKMQLAVVKVLSLSDYIGFMLKINFRNLGK